MKYSTLRMKISNREYDMENTIGGLNLCEFKKLVQNGLGFVGATLRSPERT
jgi:hypothetical protein